MKFEPIVYKVYHERLIEEDIAKKIGKPKTFRLRP